MPQSPRQMKFGISIQGGGGHWRDPAIPDGAVTDIQSYAEYARIGEEGRFDFAFIADSAYISRDSTWAFLSRLEPVVALSAVAALTRRIGLVGTLTTSFSEPFTTARQLAALDKVSGGRAGWNAVTSALEGLGRNHGHEKLYDHAKRYRIAEEYLQVVEGLWDSWEDDAFVRNRETNQYVDFDKMHTLNHQGEFFSVQGPLNIERSAQGRPIRFQAGASEPGRDLAARHADAIFADTLGKFDRLEDVAEYYRDVKRRVQAHGRNPDQVLILQGITPIVGDTPEEAEQLYQESLKYIDIEHAVKYLSRFFSFFDFSQFPLDEPLPDLGDIGNDSFRSHAEHFKKVAREKNLTLRQLALHAAGTRPGFVGTPEAIADRLQEVFEYSAADGYILLSTGHANLRNFVSKVVPILQARGLFRHEYEGTTLREHLGLDWPKRRLGSSSNA
ncbi:LLM class flavin-dependent oxidoreductase [Pseudomonas sp. LRF_L74]|uniref:LLM class flavin-dependent oxidoreductase n=1 Tax=Pseudomonas sp. LRF_L74 TaxID=3369422 RepID=UPI003F60B5AD